MLAADTLFVWLLLIALLRKTRSILAVWVTAALNKSSRALVKVQLVTVTFAVAVLLATI